MEKTLSAVIRDLGQLLNQWRADIQPDRSITSAGLVRCCNEVEELIESWEGGKNGKR